MPVRVGLTVQKYNGLDASFIISLAKRFGLEYIEVTKDVLKELPEVIRLVRGLRIGFHLPIICEDGWDFSCVRRRPEIEQLIEQLNKNWKALNIKYILSHPPEPLETTAKIEVSENYLFQNLKRLPTNIFFENVPTWEHNDFVAFLERAKKVLGKQLSGICLDAPHYFIRQNDPVKYINYWNKQIKCVHLSDCIVEHDLHLPFGMGGDLPIRDIIEALKKIKYNQYINLELLPKTFNDLPYVIYSYLKILKKFRLAKYIRSKILVLVILPLLRRVLKIG